MSQLPPAGAVAPPFSLRDRSDREHTFADHPTDSPARVLFFFKHDCATCALVAPLVERVCRALMRTGLEVLAVSQSAEADTDAFAATHALTMPVTLDIDLEVSARYGFDTVPAFVLTTPAGVVLKSFEGWAKADFSDLIALAAARCGTTTPGFERPGEPVPDQRPGCGARAGRRPTPGGPPRRGATRVAPGPRTGRR